MSGLSPLTGSSSDPAYNSGIEQGDIIVRLRHDLLSRNEVSKFLDYLELKAIRRRSRLSEDDAAELAEEIDRNVWERREDALHPYMRIYG